MSRYVVVTDDLGLLGLIGAAATGPLHGNVHRWQGSRLPERPAEVRNQLERPADLEVLILGPGMPLELALTLAAAFDVESPEVSVLLAGQPDPDIVLAALRAGVLDLLEPETGAAGVAALLHRAVRNAALHRRAVPVEQTTAEAPAGRVIAVVSPKGGVGKTTIASNLAVGLAKSAPHGTVLVDLDLQFGDVGSALSLSPEHSVSDAVYGPARRDTMVLKTFLSAHPSGLYALCAPESPDAAEGLTGEDIAHLLGQLASQYRFVVVDTAPGLSDHTLAALDQATDFLFVSGPDVPGVRGMRRELDVLAELGMQPLKRHMVLNGADFKAGVSLRDVEKVLGTSVDVVIPRSRAVALSTNQGSPLLNGSVRGPATKALQKLLARFTAPVAPARRFGPRHRIGA
ncbi:Septum site-determining protein MinD [Arthrobacter sp. SO5]|uniref:AAA family ATPase n=1 Tax=Arthrobacter sp. SO5 TaxID=1897055 RepID=UPI001E5FD2E3|nr:AAA family ATPase [Arthrobacter sp. SO5]MCB5272964.1 Septum site-determining protein MinD [Arthrobacter sp. SO5]